MLSIRVRVGLGIMTMNGYFGFFKAPLLKSHHQIQFSVILRTLVGREGLFSLRGCNRGILHAHPNELKNCQYACDHLKFKFS